MSTIRTLAYPIVMQLSRLRIRYKLIVKCPLLDSPRGPYIYAFNHSNSADIPMACRAIGHHCKVLIGKQPLYLSDRLFFWLNGAIWVDRKNKHDMHRVKEELVNHLRKMESVIWFPEGTWNLTDNLLMLPMKWGIIDVAQKSEAKIVPIVLEYDKRSNMCIALSGETIDPDGCTLSEGITLLRDSMAALRWALWEEKGCFRRENLVVNQERLAFEQDIKDYPPLDREYEQSIIFRPE